MTRKEVDEGLVCYTLLGGNDSRPLYGIGTFQETFELSQFGSVVQLPEIFCLLCQIFA